MTTRLGKVSTLALALAAAAPPARAQAPPPGPPPQPRPAAQPPRSETAPVVESRPLLPRSDQPTAPPAADQPTAPPAADQPTAPPADQPLVPPTSGPLVLPVAQPQPQPAARRPRGPARESQTEVIADIRKRSGLVSRFTPIEPGLPPDARRDQWYDTRWGDPPNLRKHPNFYLNGGIYGLPWKADCTQSFVPFFFGNPGQGTIRPDCKPVHNILRLPRAILHPFKPVGMYYDQGSYVPVYDLDPIVPGPGAWPWPFFQRLTAGGG